MVVLLLLVAQSRGRSQRAGLGRLASILRVAKGNLLALIGVYRSLNVIVVASSGASVVRACLQASGAVCPSLRPVVRVLRAGHELLGDQRVGGVDLCGARVVLVSFPSLLTGLRLPLHNVVAVESL